MIVSVNKQEEQAMSEIFSEMTPERNPDDVSQYPDWKRPDDWPFEEAWGSVNFDKKCKEAGKKRSELRRKYGFIVCPKCNTGHTNYTVTCRGCGYQPKMDH